MVETKVSEIMFRIDIKQKQNDREENQIIAFNQQTEVRHILQTLLPNAIYDFIRYLFIYKQALIVYSPYCV